MSETEVNDGSKPWAWHHAKENPGHVASYSLNAPGTCATCRARSPIWDIRISTEGLAMIDAGPILEGTRLAGERKLRLAAQAIAALASSHSAPSPLP